MNFLTILDPTIKTFKTKNDVKSYCKYMKKYTTAIYKEWTVSFQPADFLLYLWKKRSPTNRCFINLLSKQPTNNNLPDDIFNNPLSIKDNLISGKFTDNKTFIKLSEVLSTVNMNYKPYPIFLDIKKLIHEND